MGTCLDSTSPWGSAPHPGEAEAQGGDVNSRLGTGPGAWAPDGQPGTPAANPCFSPWADGHVPLACDSLTHLFSN